jgi:membrane protein
MVGDAAWRFSFVMTARMLTQSRSNRQESPPTARMWIIVLAWGLLRLIARGSRERQPTPELAPKNREESANGLRSGFAGNQHASPEAAAQKGRGRSAGTPTQIPARGWKDILWRVYEEFSNDRVMAVASGATFYVLLALFPAIAALVSIYGFFGDPATIQKHLNALSDVLPGGALEIIGAQIKRISTQSSGSLSFGFIGGLAVSLWSANAGMKAIFDALNIVYDEEEKRSFIRFTLQSLVFTLGALVFILVAIGGIIVLPIVLRFIGLGGATEWLLNLARWPVLLAAVGFGLALLYRFGPSRDEAEWKWITPGGIVAAVLWLGGSMLFSWYVTNFGSYNETYGSLGAIVGFMTWIWLSTIVVLLGAEINAEMEHQTARDTTAGPRQPLGFRGAAMADHVGAARI